ncbi:hypothetical protein [Paraburkholderia youngii]|uniref:hypothetical protein n=1 Tax=Paraburkholderia youngii TaxID=2782701 RepID=UPI003D262014
MWPVDGVIAENGGLFLRRSSDGHRVERHYWHSPDSIEHVREQLKSIARVVERAAPQTQGADDQAFRLTSLAYRCTGTDVDQRIVDAL